MPDAERKLVGTQYLDLTQLKADVEQTNALLKSIGGGVNLNMTQVVERQVRSLLESFRNEIQKMSGQTSELTGKMAGGIRQSALQIENLISVTKKLSADGSVVTTQKGYDGLNHFITEVYKNAQLVSRSLTTKGAMAEDIEYANKLYAEQIAYLKQLYTLKAQRVAIPDDTSKARRLDSQIGRIDSQLTENRELIGLLDKQVILRSKLINLQAEETRLSRQYTDASAAKSFSGAREIEQAQQAYRKLTEAVRNYNAAAKSNNTAGRTYWSQNARDAAQEIQAIGQKLGSLDLEENARKRLLDLIQKARDVELQHANALKDTGTGATALNQALDKMGGKLLQIAATYVSLRALMSFWREATSFAQEYYDKLNEIRVVSGKTQQQANEMGAAYRKLAREMNVSATEIANAAVEFFRQGLPEEEVNRRLTATIKFAKVASLDFVKSVEIITSATNTMGVSAEYVADVLAYLGDMSGSGIDEVGIAMTKASSSAMEFGLSLEWLGAYIATVAEKTRQAPEVIGTSINTMIARLHSIKEKGFNEEDATRINDVAKALASLEQPIKLIDEETGNWRDMSVIMQEIAAQWDVLDGKQKAYIATTMAGTRQQNTFLALMNDMALGLEGGSRAFELYEGAMNAAGTTAAKYAVWQESVAAAQGKLTAAMQGLYSLVNAEWMKGIYSGLAGIIDLLVEGTEAIGGWNLKIPALIIGLGGLVAVILKVAAAVKAVKAAMATGNIASALTGGNLGLIVAGIAGVVSLITMLAGSVSKAFEPVDYTEQIGSLTSHKDSVAKLAEEYRQLAAKETRTQEESNRMNTVLESLAGTSLTLRDALTSATGGFVEQAEAVKALNGYLLETESRLNSLKREQAASAFKDLGTLPHGGQAASRSVCGSVAAATGEPAQRLQTGSGGHPKL